MAQPAQGRRPCALLHQGVSEHVRGWSGQTRRECLSEQGQRKSHMGGQNRWRTLWGSHRVRLEALVRDVTGSREDPLHISGTGCPAEPLQAVG